MKAQTIALVFAVVLFTAACQAPEGPDLGSPFIGGDKALNLYLQEGMPPAVIYDKSGMPFAIGVAIQNVGEANVGKGTENPNVIFKVEGVNPAQFGLDEVGTVRTLKDESLDGAKKNFDGTIFPGGMTTVVYDALEFKPDLRGNNEYTLRVDTCYDYTTYTSTPICIKDQALELVTDSTICTLTGEKFPRNSGGPIHISSLIENPMKDGKVQVSFTVEHVGTGEFFRRPLPSNTLSELVVATNGYPCDHRVTNSNKYDVYVEIKPLDGMDVVCPRFGEKKTEGYVKLYQGQPSVVVCTITPKEAGKSRVYEDILSVNLWYMYSEFIETPMLVQDVTG